MLLTHYRQPLNWTEKGLKESKKTLDKWYKIIETNNQNLQQDHENISKKMMGALADDVNTPLAISELHQLYKAASLNWFDELFLYLSPFANMVNVRYAA